MKTFSVLLPEGRVSAPPTIFNSLPQDVLARAPEEILQQEDVAIVQVGVDLIITRTSVYDHYWTGVKYKDVPCPHRGAEGCGEATYYDRTGEAYPTCGVCGVSYVRDFQWVRHPRGAGYLRRFAPLSPQVRILNAWWQDGGTSVICGEKYHHGNDMRLLAMGSKEGPVGVRIGTHLVQHMLIWNGSSLEYIQHELPQFTKYWEYTQRRELDPPYGRPQ
ncbi:hypothetical protein HZB94_00730 [Candidatus Falkowbacteria bacterium]|nr:hypothetical protein [Candidatus Falkowbacteria bacterium]